MSAHDPEPRLRALSLAALGVVFGDIGTSPLYAIKEVFGGAHHPVPISPENVLGILSLIFWSLMVVVSLKYVTFIMRADNKGEGGIMALMALVLRPLPDGTRRRGLLTCSGCSVLHCSMAMVSSRPPSRCSRPSKAWASPLRR
jgi:KUP system potassium uptake protein